MGLRSLPFFKAKKGWQFAGGGQFSDVGGGGGGGGATPILSDVEVEVGEYNGRKIYLKTVIGNFSSSSYYANFEGARELVTCYGSVTTQDGTQYPLGTPNSFFGRFETNNARINLSGDKYGTYTITMIYFKNV